MPMPPCSRWATLPIPAAGWPNSPAATRPPGAASRRAPIRRRATTSTPPRAQPAIFNISAPRRVPATTVLVWAAGRFILSTATSMRRPARPNCAGCGKNWLSIRQNAFSPTGITPCIVPGSRASIPAAGRRDRVHGIRQFIVGTGGAYPTPLLLPLPNSEARDSNHMGVLKLVLREGGYDWAFVPVAAGPLFQPDHGSAACHDNG